ncbi:MAG: hypothetical protein ABFQ62_00405 [Patescibacteria group bacterium]
MIKLVLNKILDHNSYIAKVLVIIVLAIILRFYKLGALPHGMTWDEAAIGYNGYAVLTKRRDEWLTRFPVSFKSFGDYKAPLAIYLNGPFTYFLGMNLLAVRLPFALSGIGAILGLILLSKELFLLVDENEKKAEFFSIASGFLITLSPWHFHYSRVGFESGMSLMFVLWGFYFLIKSLRNKTKKLLFMIIASSLLVFSMYTYHSAKILAPVLTTIFLLSFWKLFRSQLSAVLLSFFWSLLLLWPMLSDMLKTSDSQRFEQASIFGQDLSKSQLISTLIANTANHFNLNFLIFGATTHLRHGDGKWGILFSTTLVLIITSIIFLIKNIKKNKYFKLFIFSLLWIIVGFIPAIIGRDVPHSNRALLALPGFLLLASLGIVELLDWLKKLNINKRIKGSHAEKNIILKIVIGLFFIIHTFLFLSFYKNYHSSFARNSAKDFKDGYLEVFEYLIPYEKGKNGKQQVNQIVFSNEYGQAYIYALFSRKTDPIWYQGGSLNRYLFVDEVKVGDLARDNSIVVATGEDLVEIAADKYILGSDGSVRFRIYHTK